MTYAFTYAVSDQMPEENRKELEQHVCRHHFGELFDVFSDGQTRTIRITKEEVPPNTAWQYERPEKFYCVRIETSFVQNVPVYSPSLQEYNIAHGLSLWRRIKYVFTKRLD